MNHDCVMAILRKDDRVLLCHRHPSREWFPNVWDLPGGHVEKFETPQQALARELHEELGVSIDPPARPADAVLESEAASVRLAIWIIEHHGPVENRCPDEHDDVRWLTLEEAVGLDLADDGYVPLIKQAFGA